MSDSCLPIYEVQVTDENVASYLYKEILRLIEKYGFRVKESLVGLQLGPNAFKCFENWGRTKQMIYYPSEERAYKFEGVRIVCGPMPFIIPLFDERGWHYACEEAKRMTAAMGGVDA